MPSLNLKQSVVAAAAPDFSEISYTDTGEAPGGFVDSPCVGSGTNGGITQFSIAIDVSQVRGFWIKAAAALTLKTNSSSAPDNTLVLKAGIPYYWSSTNSYDTFKLTIDVTTLFIVNASASATTCSCGYVFDATP